MSYTQKWYESNVLDINRIVIDYVDIGIDGFVPLSNLFSIDPLVDERELAKLIAEGGTLKTKYSQEDGCCLFLY